MATRPNILFALADDASHFGTYGHGFVHTPNIDAVTRNGVKFVNAFTCNPKCAPSRACILTGKYTWELEDAGYLAGFTGRGWKPGDYKRSGLRRNPAGDEFNTQRLTPPGNTRIASFDYAKNFVDFLSRRKEGQPFFFWYGGAEPHRPYAFGEGLRAGKSLKDIDKVPDYWPDCDEVRIDMLDYAYEIEWFDRHLGLMIERLIDIGELDNTLIVVTSDNGCPFPRVKGQMYEQDFHLPMVAQWNDGMAGAGRTVTDFVSFVDLAPTFLDAAATGPGTGMTGKSFLDVLVDDGEGQISQDRKVAYFGREKHDLGREGDLGYPVRCIRNEQYLYVRNFAPDRWPAGNPETGFTNCDYSPTKRKVLALHDEGEDFYYRMAFAKRSPEELYDIRSDPQCMENLSLRSEFRPVLEDMWKALEAFLVETRDPRLLVSPDYFDKMPTTGDDAPYTWKAYVEERWELAPHCRFDWDPKD